MTGYFDWGASAIAVCALTWTILPLIRHDAWWIRAFEFPRVQLTSATVLVLVAYAGISGWTGMHDKVILAALLICILFQLTRIARYTPAWPVQVKSTRTPIAERTLSVFVANVLTPNRNSDALLDLVRRLDPDVVLTLETDAWWQRRLDAIAPDYPHAVKYPLDNLYGMHLYSKLPLKNPEVLFLVEDDVPSIHADVTLRCGHVVELRCLHPAPPSPTENPTSAERDAELLVVARTIGKQHRSVVVMGDLNDVAWSATTRLFQRLSGLLDPRIGRGTFSTFHARYPFLRWPLDHVFCSDDFTVRTIARLEDIGSDHFPMHVILQYAPGVETAHEQPEANDRDIARAGRKIANAAADSEGLRRRQTAARAG